MLLGKLAHDVDVFLGQHAAGRILRRVDDEHPRLRGDERSELVEVHAETRLFPQRHGPGHRTDEVDLRRVGGIPRIGHDHLIAGLHACEQGEEQHVLRTGDQDDLGRIDLRLQRSAHEARDRLARLIDPARGRVVRVAVLHRADCSLDDVVGGGEIRLADLQVDDPLAFGFELARPGEDFERALGPQSGHALGETNRGAHGLNPIRWCSRTSRSRTGSGRTTRSPCSCAPRARAARPHRCSGPNRGRSRARHRP